MRAPWHNNKVVADSKRVNNLFILTEAYRSFPIPVVGECSVYWRRLLARNWVIDICFPEKGCLLGKACFCCRLHHRCLCFGTGLFGFLIDCSIGELVHKFFDLFCRLGEVSVFWQFFHNEWEWAHQIRRRMGNCEEGVDEA